LFTVADKCFDAAKLMCRPTLCLGPAVALAAVKAHATSCPLAPYVKLGMRDGVAVVPWSWISLCVKVGKMPVGKFIFISTWAIRMTACFIYRVREVDRAAAPDGVPVRPVGVEPISRVR